MSGRRNLFDVRGGRVPNVFTTLSGGMDLWNRPESLSPDPPASDGDMHDDQQGADYQLIGLPSNPYDDDDDDDETTQIATTANAADDDEAPGSPSLSNVSEDWQGAAHQFDNFFGSESNPNQTHDSQQEDDDDDFMLEESSANSDDDDDIPVPRKVPNIDEPESDQTGDASSDDSDILVANGDSNYRPMSMKKSKRSAPSPAPPPGPYLKRPEPWKVTAEPHIPRSNECYATVDGDKCDRPRLTSYFFCADHAGEHASFDGERVTRALAAGRAIVPYETFVACGGQVTHDPRQGHNAILGFPRTYQTVMDEFTVHGAFAWVCSARELRPGKKLLCWVPPVLEPLSADEMRRVWRLWHDNSPDTIREIQSGGPWKIDDFKDLRMPVIRVERVKWLVEVIMNCEFLTLMWLHRRKGPKTRTMASFASDKLGRGEYTNLVAFSASHFTKERNYAEMEVNILHDGTERVLVPIHVGGNHWYLCRVDIRAKRGYIYDSILDRDTFENYAMVLPTLVRHLGVLATFDAATQWPSGHFDPDVEWTFVRVVCTRQGSTFCGSYACAFAEAVMTGSPMQRDGDHELPLRLSNGRWVHENIETLDNFIKTYTKELTRSPVLIRDEHMPTIRARISRDLLQYYRVSHAKRFNLWE
jgi:hypothetical protein